MEALIFGLIVMAIGAFFNNKKGAGDSDAPAKRKVPGREAGQRTFKRAEDYAKEIYGELQTQMNDHPERAQQVKHAVEKAAEKAPVKKAQKQAKEMMSPGRLSAHNPQPLAKEKESGSEELLPLDANDVQRGIILAEILSPPKSRR
ncbi:hypothetical protein [Planococcus shenhongbingii]|uniref:Uncharacterized protein n=1 Tax=Planococcus shenhongbingii TaxID=3058398 RepID=A0ABT8ND28_9BACL|nr:hypothetical protein [Planococcus sp. N017]MDN7245799.1 hypothetical protein [Planococcus sp. N017]